jgi:hypothetical protein
MLSRTKLGVAISACLIGVSMSGWEVQAGSLTPPPGPPGSTMKTLEEVEPRTLIHASDIPLTITEPGSYYLTETITSSVTAITIEASNVTLDLRGFALIGSGTGAADGIYVSYEAQARNVTIRNGEVREWGGSGVNAAESEHCRLIDLTAVDNGDAGLWISSGCVTRCLAEGNGGGGIYVNRGTVTESFSRGNGGDGIGATASAVSDCLATYNGGHGIVAFDSTVTRCRVRENGGDGIRADGGTVIGCMAQRNTGEGVHVESGGAVLDSLAVLNRSHGVTAHGGSQLRGNICIRNGWGGAAAGVYVSHDGNRVEGNHVIGSDRGIEVDGLNNVIVRNSATSNTTNYDIVAGNAVGPNGTAATAASPWANIDN